MSHVYVHSLCVLRCVWQTTMCEREWANLCTNPLHQLYRKKPLCLTALYAITLLLGEILPQMTKLFAPQSKLMHMNLSCEHHMGVYCDGINHALCLRSISTNVRFHTDTRVRSAKMESKSAVERDSELRLHEVRND